MQQFTESDLRNEIRDMQERFPRLQESDLFVASFLKCVVTEDEKDAVGALVDGARDKSGDAVYVDDAFRTGKRLQYDV